MFNVGFTNPESEGVIIGVATASRTETVQLFDVTKVWGDDISTNTR
jgi:hypothetical protein